MARRPPAPLPCVSPRTASAYRLSPVSRIDPVPTCARSSRQPAARTTAGAARRYASSCQAPSRRSRGRGPPRARRSGGGGIGLAAMADGRAGGHRSRPSALGASLGWRPASRPQRGAAADRLAAERSGVRHGRRGLLGRRGPAQSADAERARGPRSPGQRPRGRQSTRPPSKTPRASSTRRTQRGDAAITEVPR